MARYRHYDPQQTKMIDDADRPLHQRSRPSGRDAAAGLDGALPAAPRATVGLVIERQRRSGERDGFQWYCPRCPSLLHETFIELTDIEAQRPQGRS